MSLRFWVGGSGTWDGTSTANWATSSGGAPGASAPTTADAVNFDSLSGAAATVTVAATATCSNCTINKSDIVLSLSGSPTFASFVQLVTGTLTLNSFTLSATTFSSNNANARTINFGTGKLSLSGTGSVWDFATATNFSSTGTQVVDITNATATATAISAGAVSEANTVSFNIKAGTYTLTITSNVRSLDFTGFSGTLANATKLVYGNLTLSPTMTVAAGAAAICTMSATSGTKTITTNGVSIDCPFNISGAGGTFQLQDSLTLGSSRAITLTNGVFDTNSKAVSVGAIVLGAGTKSLTLGTSVVTITGTGSSAFDLLTNAAGLTFSGASATIIMASSVAKTFRGNGNSFGTVTQGGTGTLKITGSNTIGTFNNTATGCTITFSAGSTQTITNWNVSGGIGSLVTINSQTAGTPFTLSKSSGAVSASYLSIQDSTATGGATWTAYNSTDVSGNTGWVFSAMAFGAFATPAIGDGAFRCFLTKGRI